MLITLKIFILLLLKHENRSYMVKYPTIRRVALRAPGITQSNIFWKFFPFLHRNIANKGQRIISQMDPKI